MKWRSREGFRDNCIMALICHVRCPILAFVHCNWEDNFRVSCNIFIYFIYQDLYLTAHCILSLSNSTKFYILFATTFVVDNHSNMGKNIFIIQQIIIKCDVAFVLVAMSIVFVFWLQQCFPWNKALHSNLFVIPDFVPNPLDLFIARIPYCIYHHYRYWWLSAWCISSFSA